MIIVLADQEVEGDQDGSSGKLDRGRVRRHWSAHRNGVGRLNKSKTVRRPSFFTRLCCPTALAYPTARLERNCDQSQKLHLPQLEQALPPRHPQTARRS